MVEIKYCPSTLAEGYDSYSPQAVKRLFDGRKVSPYLDFNISELKQTDEIVRAMQRISVSGVQEKFSGVIDGNLIRIAESSERATYIIKPAPWDETIATRKQIPASIAAVMRISRSASKSIYRHGWWIWSDSSSWWCLTISTRTGMTT